MSLDVYLEAMKPTEVFSANITHNLTEMADAAGIYAACWRPEEIGAKVAEDIIPYLESGLKVLKSDPDGFKKYNPENGWGDYECLVGFVEEYLDACKVNPGATIRVWR